MIRVLLADDQTLLRDGLRTILDAQDDIQVVGEACDGASAVREARRLRPDVVLMDVRMPVLNGLQAARELLRDLTDTRILVLTTFDVDEYVYDALRLGASGFLIKDVPRAQLIDGIRTVAAGNSLLAPSITRRLVEHFVHRPPVSLSPRSGVLDSLTGREREVLRLVACGMSNAEIAEAMFVAESTVKTHMAHVLAKLGLRDRVQAVVTAYEAGLVSPGDQPTTSCS